MRRAVGLLVLALFVVGCSDTPPPNAEGPAAKSGKTYSKADAEQSRPRRKGQGD